MKTLGLLCTAAFLFAGEAGVRPRASASDYPARQSGAGVTIGAAILPPDQVKKLFPADLVKLGYIVVELAVYPDRNVEIAARDFALRVPSDGSILRPVAPSTISARLHRKDSPPPKIPGNVQVYGAQSVGYGTGGVRRAGGVYTDTTVGVAVGGPPAPPPPPRTAPNVLPDLENAALPEGQFSRPVAGYLYFPSIPKKAAVDLTWYGADGQVRLSLPSTK